MPTASVATSTSYLWAQVPRLTCKLAHAKQKTSQLQCWTKFIVSEVEVESHAHSVGGHKHIVPVSTSSEIDVQISACKAGTSQLQCWTKLIVSEVEVEVEAHAHSVGGHKHIVPVSTSSEIDVQISACKAENITTAVLDQINRIWGRGRGWVPCPQRRWPLARRTCEQKFRDWRVD